MGFIKDIKNKMFIDKNVNLEGLEDFLTMEERLLSLFEKDDSLPVKYVLDETGIKNEHVLRTVLYNIRKERKMNLRSKFENIVKKPFEEKRKKRNAKR